MVGKTLGELGDLVLLLGKHKGSSVPEVLAVKRARGGNGIPHAEAYPLDTAHKPPNMPP